MYKIHHYDLCICSHVQKAAHLTFNDLKQLIFIVTEPAAAANIKSISLVSP